MVGSACGQPLLPDRPVGVEPASRGLVAGELPDGDVAGDRVLVVVGPAEVLDQVGRRAARSRRTPCARSCRGRTAGSRRRRSSGRRRSRACRAAAGCARARSRTAATAARRSSRSAVPASASALRNAAISASSLPAYTTVKSSSEVLDQRGVVGDEGRVAVEELALAAGLAGAEHASAYSLRFFQSMMSGCSLGHPRRHVPADDALVAGQALLDRDLAGRRCSSS